MRSKAFAAALLTGCALASLAGCVAPSGITAASVVEIPAAGSPREPGSGRARDVIGEVRLGYGLDVDGKVPPGFGTTKFAVGEPIQLSMWEVTDAPAGSVVGLRVRDLADRIVWSADKAAPRGGSYVSFGIGRGLARGMYRADVILASEVTSSTSFEVFERKVP